MIKQFNEESNQIQLIREAVIQICLTAERQHGPIRVTESYSNLQQTIKKILVTNKEIPIHLSLVIAKTIVFSSLLNDMIESKKRYKKYKSLKKVYDFITDKTATDIKPASSEQVDNVIVDIISIIKEVTSQLTGNADSVMDIQQTFDSMIERLSTNTTERNRVQIMKLASLITQSNSNVSQRKSFINQHLSKENV